VYVLFKPLQALETSLANQIDVKDLARQQQQQQQQQQQHQKTTPTPKNNTNNSNKNIKQANKQTQITPHTRPHTVHVYV
jgi:hypothetical protein